MKPVIYTLRQRLLPVLRAWGAPALGAIYLVFWLIEIRANNWQLSTIMMALFLAVSIALSARQSLISFALLIVAPLSQLVYLFPGGADLILPICLGGCFIAFIAGIRSVGLTRFLAIPAGAIASIFVAYIAVRSRDWLTMTTISGDSVSGHPRWVEFGTLSLACFGLYTAAWAIGVAIASLTLGRTLKAAESQLEETDFELRLQLDRARISRDVHDALAHSLTIVVSQAEGALALQAARPEVAEESLRTIASVGRTALIDVRNLVERIQDDDVLTMKQTTADLPALAEDMRSIGLDTTVQILGEPKPLPPSHDITVFRIVQESLTNTLKHSGATSTATVALDWHNDGLTVLVSSVGHSAAGHSSVSHSSAGPDPLIAEHEARGVGIEGMKERARLAGGWLTATSAGENVFIVTAFIPVDAASSLPAQRALAPAATPE